MLLVIGLVQASWAAVGLALLCAVTLCLIYPVMLIPILGLYPIAAVSLPVLVFQRCYSLEFVSQFGPEYRVPWRYESSHAFPVELAAAPLPAPATEQIEPAATNPNENPPPGI
jgi:hypothetical protein